MEEKAENTWFSDIWFTNNLCPLIVLLVPSHLFPSQPSNPSSSCKHYWWKTQQNLQLWVNLVESEIEEGNKLGNICLFWSSDFQTLVLQPLVKGVLLGKGYRIKINLKQRKCGTVSVMLSILFLLAFIHQEDAVGSRVWKWFESESWHRRRFLNKTQQNLWEPTPSSPFPSVFPSLLVIVL